MESKQSKKSQIIQSLKNNKFQNLKGSANLIEMIRQQREKSTRTNFNSSSSSSSFSESSLICVEDRVCQNELDSSDINELVDLLNKQQKVIRQLDNENINLINDSNRMKSELACSQMRIEILSNRNEQ